MFRPITGYPPSGALSESSRPYLEGGMAYVYRSWSPKYGDVALKIPKPHANLRRFEAEWITWGRLGRHRNIVTLFESGTDDGLEFVVMEYVPYPDLQRLRRQLPDGRLDPRTSARIIIELCDALAYAYERGGVLAHRDVKPSNIFVQLDGGNVKNVKLSDFGIVKLDVGVTIDCEVLGAPSYASPEQLTYGAKLDQRSDIYSLGVTLYELVTGHLPFEGNRDEVIEAHRRLLPPPPTLYNPHVPDELTRIITKCLEKDPSKRYEDVHELAKDLEHFLRADKSSPMAAPTVSTATILRLAFGVFTIAGAEIGLAALLWSGPRNPTTTIVFGSVLFLCLLSGFTLVISGAICLLSTPPSAVQEQGIAPSHFEETGKSNLPTYRPAANLVAVGGPLAGRSFSVNGSRTTIGRDPESNVPLPEDDRFASRRHCSIIYREGRFVLTDESLNGTLVNGRPVTGAVGLRHGDLIHAGLNEFRFELLGPRG